MSHLSLLHTPSAILEDGTDTTTSAAVTVNTGASSWGSWTELVPSTATHTNKLQLRFWPYALYDNDTNATKWSYVQIGIGAAGSEVVILDKISIQGYMGFQTYVFDVDIPKGSRIVIRIASASAQAYKASVLLWNQRSSKPVHIVDSSYTEAGSSPANAPSQNLATPTADNTWTSWTELVASASEDATEIMLMINSYNRTGGEGAENLLFQLGKGAAGSEVAVDSSTFPHFMASYSDYVFAYKTVIPFKVTAGERIVIRWQDDNWAAHTAYDMRCMFMLFGD